MRPPRSNDDTRVNLDELRAAITELVPPHLRPKAATLGRVIAAALDPTGGPAPIAPPGEPSEPAGAAPPPAGPAPLPEGVARILAALRGELDQQGAARRPSGRIPLVPLVPLVLIPPWPSDGES